nr:MAK10-like protein [Tanacetum cinerariifolium]
MGDENPIRTLRDYSRPSHEDYRNTIVLADGNNVVPLRSDTIQLVQNECSFHELWFKDPNQHLKDFLELVDSLDLDVENKKRTRLHLFQFSLRDQARNWLERLPAGSISTWEDLTTRFLAQFFPPGRTFKLRNDILMFKQHQGESLFEAWTRFKDLLQKCEIDCAAGGKLRDKNAQESWEIIENLALNDHEGWNDPRDLAKPMTANSLPQDTLRTPDRRLLELEDQVSFLLKGSRMGPKTSSTYIPQAYAEAISSNPHSRNLDETPRQNSFTFQKRACPDLQHQSLELSFKARVQGYTAVYTKRIERFEKAIFKQRDVINDRMAEMFGLLKELTTSRTPKKVLLVRSVNEELVEELVEMPRSQSIGYYRKHEINEKLIEGLIGTITLKFGKNKINLSKIPESLCRVDEETENDIDHAAPTVSRLILEWEERIKLHQEKEMEFSQWRSKVFNDGRSALVNEGCEVIFDEEKPGSF